MRARAAAGSAGSPAASSVAARLFMVAAMRAEQACGHSAVAGRSSAAGSSRSTAARNSPL